MAQNTLTVAEVTAFADRIKAALANAEADRRTVQALRSLLGGSGRAVNLGLGRGRGRGGSEQVEAKVLEAVKSSKTGIRLGEIVDALGLNRAMAARALQKLRQKGEIKLVGHKRLARYHVA
ncbi:MAG TPA: helix-turn-helix domain-containing protein [Polyangia bacterium]|nr:helix-turn-helix domain-containing protein [Polyangia bacterium]